MNRRKFIAASTSSLLGLSLPRRIRAAVAPAASDLKFVFVFCNGGWDPTRVFAPEFSNPNVDMEPDASTSTVGGISFVDHPQRPNVRAFFEKHAERMLVINGVQVRSIAHDICTRIALTGGTSGFSPDWATVIANADTAGSTLPNLVLGGPSFPGPFATSMARTGEAGQLEALLSGDIVHWTDTPAGGLSAASEGIVDRYLKRRASARAQMPGSVRDLQLSAAFEDAVHKAIALKDYRFVMDFSGGRSLTDQFAVATSALQRGVSRCASTTYPGKALPPAFDTHVTNDQDQLPLWEELFGGLSQLMGMLAIAPGHVAPTLVEETVLVVLSELGRSPQINGKLGKDHWPYTSMLIVGPGITGNRVVGGFDDGYYGNLMDLDAGEPHADGRVLSIESVGASLLALADVDPADHLPGVAPLYGMLA